MTVNRYPLHVSATILLLLLTGMPGFAQRNTEVRPSHPVVVQQGARYAQPSGLDAIVQVDFKRISVDEALKQVSRMAKLELSYADRTVQSDKVVTLQLKSVTARTVIENVLKGTGLQLVVRADGSLTILPVQNVEQAQETGNIIGVVIDSATKAKVEGASISIVGAKLTGISDKQGSFRFHAVPVGKYTVTAKMLGYSSKGIGVVVESQKDVTVKLVLPPASTVLSEVVTTVTGNQRKIEIGNDITTLDVPEIMKQAPITSVTDLLEARVPGLTVMRTSGVPGAPSRIRLRGMGGGMLSNVPGAPTNDPIVVVDGIRIYAGQSGADDQKLGGGTYPVPSPIDQIDPNSIEKIEVLRGPSAAAMYGSDAANGVIVISTKKGRVGAMRWDVAASRGIESMTGTYAAPGFYRFGYNPFFQGTGAEGLCPAIQSSGYSNCLVDSVVRFQALNNSRLSTIGRGTNTRFSGTTSGGTQAFTYSVTGSMENTLGLTRMPALYQDLYRQLYDSTPSRRMRRPDALDERSGQATFAADLAKGLTAQFTTSMSQLVQRQSSANAQLALLSSMYIDTTNINPVEPGEYAKQVKTDATVVRHALALNLSRWQRLPLSATFGLDRNERNQERFTPRDILIILERLNSPGGPILRSEMSKGAFREGHENFSTTTASINGTLFPRSRISMTMGTSVTGRSNTTFEGFSDTLVPGISRPSTLIGGTRTGRNTTTGGWFLEPRLNLNSRFFLNPGFRFDGGGASGSQSGFNGGLLSLFPKINFSWIAIDREGGAPLWGMISLLRPRFAFGVAGRQPAAEMSLRTLEQDMAGWSPGSTVDTIAPNLGLRLRSIGNTKLGPEQTREVEGGFDLQLWETRLTVSVTGFYKRTKNAMQQLPLAPSVGVGTMNYYANIGHVRNTGAELSLNANLLDLPNIGWNIDVSVSRDRNTLTKLFGDQPYIDLGNGTRLVEGYPLFSRWARPISGWANPTNGTKLWYGDYVVDDSAVYMGMQAPDFEMPFRTALTLFRGLVSVNGQFNYKAGLTQNNLGGGTLLSNIYDNPNSTYGQQAYALAAACFIQGQGQAASAAKNPCTDYGFIQKVNSLRFNSMSVGFNVPRAYLKRLPVSSVSLFLQGSNLGLWTNYRGKDPDVNGTLIGDATSDSGQLPMPRTWSFQIRIGT